MLASGIESGFLGYGVEGVQPCIRPYGILSTKVREGT